MKLFFNEINKLYFCQGLKKTRLGNKHDGGYVLFDELCTYAPALYSFGVGDDVGFERDVVSKYNNIRFVKLIDPTIDSLPEENEKFELSSEIDINSVVTDSILKIDIEGHEWDFFIDYSSILNKFSQIVCEFHVFHIESWKGCYSKYFNQLYADIAIDINNQMFQLYGEIIQKLNELFYIFHIHPNNSLAPVEVNGYTFPPLLEVSFVNKNLIHKKTPSFLSSTKLIDSPNKIDRPDIMFFFPVGNSKTKIAKDFDYE